MDIALEQDISSGKWDISFLNGDLKTSASLINSYQISLFCNRNSGREIDEIKEGGYWGDILEEGHITGSKIWLLDREKITKETINLIQEYALESCKWLIKDGIVISHTIEIEVKGNSLNYKINSILPEGEAETIEIQETIFK